MSSMVSRHRKQRFPRLERRRLTGYTRPSLSEIDCVLSDDEAAYPNQTGTKRVAPRPNLVPVHKSYRASNPSTLGESKDTTCSSACRLDKRARDEHNEQERSRRRELAVIYELIRCSLSEDDLRYLGQFNGPKSIDKLSYPQVLHVAYHLLREEQHNLVLFERSLNEVKQLEKELIHVGLPVPQRPSFPSMMDNYKKVIQVVDNLLRHDKSSRAMDGVYEVSPSERASLGNRQLATLRPRPHGTYNHSPSLSDPLHRVMSGGSRRYAMSNRHIDPRASDLYTTTISSTATTTTTWPSSLTDLIPRKSARRHASSPSSSEHCFDDMTVSMSRTQSSRHHVPDLPILTASHRSSYDRLDNAFSEVFNTGEDDEDSLTPEDTDMDMLINFLPT